MISIISKKHCNNRVLLFAALLLLTFTTVCKANENNEVEQSSTTTTEATETSSRATKVASVDSYLIFTPHIWQKGFDHVIVFDLIKTSPDDEAAQVDITLMPRANSKLMFRKKATVAVGHIDSVKFRLPQAFPAGFYNLTISGKASQSGNAFKNFTKDIQYKTDTSGVYITTDKPMYRASDTVNVRIVGIDGHLKPVDAALLSLLEILDPSENRLQQSKNLTFRNGLIDNVAFELSSRPTLGTWKIKALFEEREILATFEVQEYVLPKYEIVLETPSYLLRSAKTLDGVIQAKYTYGKPVKGHVLLRLEDGNVRFCPKDTEPVNAGVAIAAAKRYMPTYCNNKFKVEKLMKLSSSGTGKTSFSMPLDPALKNLYWITLNTTVVDEYTNERISKQIDINLYEYLFQANLKQYYFEPKKLNTFTIYVRDPLYKPLVNAELTVEVEKKKAPKSVIIFEDAPDQSTSTTAAPSTLTFKHLKTDQNGIIKVDVDLTGDDDDSTTNIEFKLTLEKDSTQQIKLTAYKQYPSAQSVQLAPARITIKGIAADNSTSVNSEDQMQQVKFKANTVAKFQVNLTNEDNTCIDVKYVIVSRSFVSDVGQHHVCFDNGQHFATFDLDVELTSLNAPQSNIFVYYLNASNHLFAENLHFDVAEFYNNELTLAFDKTLVEPGEQVTLSIRTRPDSLVALSVIDQSVALLGTSNELSSDQVSAQLNSLTLYGYYPSYEDLEEEHGGGGGVGGDAMLRGRPYPGGFWEVPESIRKFQYNGFVFFSDLSTLKKVRRMCQIMPFIAMRGDAMAMDAAAGAPQMKVALAANTESAQAAPAAPAAEPRVRKDFSETWIWQTVSASGNGTASISSQIPDTITSWVASGYSLNSKYGLGLASKANVTAFKGFFVSMQLPASMVRGERLILQCVVSNYLDQDLTNVHVTLAKNENFRQVVDEKGSSVAIDEDLVHELPQLKAQQVTVVTFAVTPTKLGKLPLLVKARAAQAQDAEQRLLQVHPEGIAQSATLNWLVDLRSAHSSEHEFPVRFPDDRVPESEFCELQVLGNILGSAFNNLGKLLVKPCGCGEQTMLSLTPNIYALRYLNALERSGSDTSNSKSLRESALKNILYGYQNELKYRHLDGSFSAFGETDKSGSAWLTAFVVKSFRQAKEFEPAIDDSVVAKATEWLLKQQAKDGAFDEPGTVIHKEMQGGVNSRVTSSAYILIALTESSPAPSAAEKAAISKCVGYLEEQLANNKDLDAYGLSLITYALHLAHSKLASSAFERFESLGNTSVSGQLFWSKKGGDSQQAQGRMWYMPVEPPSSDVEMTSYALLTYLLRADQGAKSFSIARWLVSKSNGLGAYSSTQNTVLALQALSQFALDILVSNEVESGNSTSLNIELTANERRFLVTRDNSLVLQTWQIENCSQSDFKVSLDASGEGGLALVQLVLSYNMPKQQVPVQAFELSQRVKKVETSNNLRLETCVKYTFDKSSAGMSVVESALLSGFVANLDELRALTATTANLKLVEVSRETNKVAFYFDKLDAQEQVCFEWNIRREVQVENIQPAAVRVFDYYRPHLEVTVLYNEPSDLTTKQEEQ